MEKHNRDLIIERIEGIMQKNGLNAKEFAMKINVGNSKITDWRNGKTTPTINDIIGISQIFDISCDYLLTGKSYPVSNLSITEMTLLNKFSKCSDFEKGLIIGYIDRMIDEHSSFQDKTTVS